MTTLEKYVKRSPITLSAAAVLASLALVACGPQETPAPATTVTSAPTQTPLDGHHTLTGWQVHEAFLAAKLPAANPRENTQLCTGQNLGCSQVITTDNLSIYVFDGKDSPAQVAFAKLYGKNSYSSGNVVLSYAAARTPEANRQRYQKVLDGLK